MKTLAIETSCDETAIAIVEANNNLDEIIIHAHELFSQVEDHEKYGGVYPSLAKRLHAQNLPSLLDQTLKNASVESKEIKITPHKQLQIKESLSREKELYNQLYNYLESHPAPKIDQISVTVGPGLEPALWVGISFAKALSAAWDIPIQPINHMEGHIASVLAPSDINIETPCSFSSRSVSFPALALLVSGGHTELVLVNNWENYEKIGQTRDDAAGEAFDKVGRLLNLPYPGGPHISRLSATIRNKPKNEGLNKELGSISLPRPMIDSDDLDFSFSGLKTAVMRLTKKVDVDDSNTQTAIAKEFEDAVIEVLKYKTIQALKKHPEVQSLIVAGGVSANQYLRNELEKEVDNIPTLFPHPNLTADNAVMIGFAALLRSIKKGPDGLPGPELVAKGRLSL